MIGRSRIYDRLSPRGSGAARPVRARRGVLNRYPLMTGYTGGGWRSSRTRGAPGRPPGAGHPGESIDKSMRQGINVRHKTYTTGVGVIWCCVVSYNIWNFTAERGGAKGVLHHPLHARRRAYSYEETEEHHDRVRDPH
jgi:hypothetical protein